MVTQSGYSREVRIPLIRNVQLPDWPVVVAFSQKKTRSQQVKNNFRAAITLPEKSWPKFRDMFGEFVTKMDAARGLSSSSTETPNAENSEATAQTLGPVGEGILMGAEALALGAVGGLGASGFPSAKSGHGSSSAPNE